VSKLVRVPFCGDHLDAVKNKGVVWVSLSRVCKNVGLCTERQKRKLKAVPWAKTAVRCVRGKSGQRQMMFMTHIDTLPVWLKTVDATRATLELQDKVARYQTDATRVLREYFYGKRHYRG
jgi:hypothetical protein